MQLQTTAPKHIYVTDEASTPWGEGGLFLEIGRFSIKFFLMASAVTVWRNAIRKCSSCKPHRNHAQDVYFKVGSWSRGQLGASEVDIDIGNESKVFCLLVGWRNYWPTCCWRSKEWVGKRTVVWWVVGWRWNDWSRCIKEGFKGVMWQIRGAAAEASCVRGPPCKWEGGGGRGACSSEGCEARSEGSARKEWAESSGLCNTTLRPECPEQLGGVCVCVCRFLCVCVCVCRFLCEWGGLRRLD